MDYSLSNAEKKILDFLWENKKWATCSEIVEHFKEEKDWKRQTVNTFLTHLINKGLVIKNGRKYIYSYTEEEFNSQRTAALIENLYGGSVKNFMSALTGKNAINKKYADELREYLDSFSDDK